MKVIPQHNFSAGPAVLPQIVLLKVQAELLDIGNSQSSVMELSHRSPQFEAIHNKAQNDLRILMDIPDSHAILFMQGGATAQFACVYYNLAQCPTRCVDYCISGAWSEKAANEVRNLGGNVHAVFNSKNNGHTGILPVKDWKFSENPAYIFFVSNETIHGVETNDMEMLDAFPKDVPIVCDMSSNILSRHVDVARYGCIFAGAQKNIGPAGVTIVIIKKSLLDLPQRPAPTPVCFDYKIMYANNSLYNTPPTFAIYMSGLVFEYLLANGGIPNTQAQAQEKSGKIYRAIAERSHLYLCPVQSPYRSRMNIPFRVCRNGSPCIEREEDFLKKAAMAGMNQLQGHRSVGGVRASCYNALPMESVDFLVKFMKEWHPNEPQEKLDTFC